MPPPYDSYLSMPACSSFLKWRYFLCASVGWRLTTTIRASNTDPTINPNSFMLNSSYGMEDVDFNLAISSRTSWSIPSR